MLSDDLEVADGSALERVRGRFAAQPLGCLPTFEFWRTARRTPLALAFFLFPFSLVLNGALVWWLQAPIFTVSFYLWFGGIEFIVRRRINRGTSTYAPLLAKSTASSPLAEVIFGRTAYAVELGLSLVGVLLATASFSHLISGWWCVCYLATLFSINALAKLTARRRQPALPENK